jgi:hypothetical protein
MTLTHDEMRAISCLGNASWDESYLTQLLVCTAQGRLVIGNRFLLYATPCPFDLGSSMHTIPRVSGYIVDALGAMMARPTDPIGIEIPDGLGEPDYTTVENGPRFSVIFNLGHDHLGQTRFVRLSNWYLAIARLLGVRRLVPIDPGQLDGAWTGVPVGRPGSLVIIMPMHPTPSNPHHAIEAESLCQA